jgi:hypothetical protein
MDAVAAPGDPVAAWLQFGLQRHGRAKIVGFRNAEIPIDLDRVAFVWIPGGRFVMDHRSNLASSTTIRRPTMTSSRPIRYSSPDSG